MRAILGGGGRPRGLQGKRACGRRGRNLLYFGMGPMYYVCTVHVRDVWTLKRAQPTVRRPLSTRLARAEQRIPERRAAAGLQPGLPVLLSMLWYSHTAHCPSQFTAHSQFRTRASPVQSIPSIVIQRISVQAPRLERLGRERVWTVYGRGNVQDANLQFLFPDPAPEFHFEMELSFQVLSIANPLPIPGPAQPCSILPSTLLDI
ncbi:hypothetical protein B0J11DRAFT_277174 [Dendryphion nanum]|uniref:Uncharacterized protein n=1 Tax=Dendryphion nanum TaxID=256645 RepID=A0A9P9E0W2_9PLEO|nr:hypothetical protein B0J11DRAFT_277174 [Dendryphion nanum]